MKIGLFLLFLVFLLIYGCKKTLKKENSTEYLRKTAWSYLDGSRNKVDVNKSLTLLEKASISGDKRAIADYVVANVITHDSKSMINERIKGLIENNNVLSILSMACQKSDLIACGEAAILYVVGVATEKDPKQAASLFKKACDGGSEIFCIDLATMYIGGTGIEENVKKGIEMLISFCDKKKNPWACDRIGTMFQVGIGVEKDLDVAISYYSRACKNGIYFSCNNLGVIYKDMREYKKAMNYFKKACDMGYELACENLNTLLDKGE